MHTCGGDGTAVRASPRGPVVQFRERREQDRNHSGCNNHNNTSRAGTHDRDTIAPHARTLRGKLGGLLSLLKTKHKLFYTRGRAGHALTKITTEDSNNSRPAERTTTTSRATRAAETASSNSSPPGRPPLDLRSTSRHCARTCGSANRGLLDPSWEEKEAIVSHEQTGTAITCRGNETIRSDRSQ